MVSATWIHHGISNADLHLETYSSRLRIDINSPSPALHQRDSNGTIQKMRSTINIEPSSVNPTNALQQRADIIPFPDRHSL
ncbi:hypothetical protein BLNAU_20252 [Blattamonas nauphoetae]|uniref:Uncharacterized protein n=1 Tax=Blattamonas nauphoetae TaxID=2049346 RepID=A0ABQ9WZC5_9EUKA|nr:hypothetical protein BLNAU_20252 [Blattamonas nauphoetae]